MVAVPQLTRSASRSTCARRPGRVALALVVAWVVVLGTLSPFAAETAALRWIPATIVTVVATLEPVGAAVLAWWWFGESLTALQVVGFVLVLGGVVLALVARSAGAAARGARGRASAGASARARRRR